MNAPLLGAGRPPLGWWSGGVLQEIDRPEVVREALADLARPLWLVATGERVALARGGQARLGDAPEAGALPVVAGVPPCRPSDLGDAGFRRDLGLRLPCLAGAMAHGIASVELVEAMGRAGMAAFFGAAGLAPRDVEAALDRLAVRLEGLPWGANLIHIPDDPALEATIARLYVRRGVRLVSASAYMDLSLALIHYRFHGIHQDPAGRVVVPHRVVATVSRPEVARKLLSPPPPDLLGELIRRGDLTEAQARMAASVPVAEDLTVEADSGGHTDNRPAVTLLPAILALRDRLQAQHGYDRPLRVGAAGGIATPHAAAAAFAMGAAFIVTGTVNQGCVEAGTSDEVRRLLAEAGPADVCMAPSPDMFEMGARVQVLKRGTLYPMRAQRLYELYRRHERLEDLPDEDRANLEKNLFRAPLDVVWRETRAFWSTRDPARVERAEREPRFKMALVFRWYLGQSSRWAVQGVPDRRIDYQIWCGPAMGAFNEWAAGTFLEDWRNRRVAVVGHAILAGAAFLLRAQALRGQAISLAEGCFQVSPQDLTAGGIPEEKGRFAP